MKINLIGVPLMYGSGKPGVDLGPTKFRERGMLERIRKHGHELYDMGDLYVKEIKKENMWDDKDNIKYLSSIVDTNRNLAHAVNTALEADSFPFIVGGDHSLGLGSVSGASKHFDDLAVIWVDAHGDINTGDTSPSGNFHGMPLAALMDIGTPETTNLYFDGIKVKPENVYIFGARDLDEGEVKLAKELDLNMYTMDDIRETGLDAAIADVIEKVKASNVDGVHLSFDIDSLDAELVPGTGTPVPEGFTLDEGKQVLGEILKTGMIDSMDFVELNTYLDRTNTTIDNSLEVMEHVFKVLKDVK